MIKARPMPSILLLVGARLVSLLLRWKFNKLKFNEITVKPGHSYLLMCNHFSFWDGFLAAYIAYKALYKNPSARVRHLYIMSVEKQLRKHLWMRYFGSFSIAPGIRKIEESLNYAAGVLDNPENVLLFFPQGKLESSHIRTIVLQDGLRRLVPKITGHCQLIWCSNVLEYFESLRPSVTFNLLDCGSNTEFDFDRLSLIINDHHRQALRNQVRFTEED